MPVSTAYSYLWEFGDGETSHEKDPKHVYRMAGTYTVKLTVTSSGGTNSTITITDYIHVYEWDYTNDTLHVANTDKCYRSAVGLKQGMGITRFLGDNWLWPTAYTGTCIGYTEANDPVTIVCNNRSGKFYRIGIPELWTDKTDEYGGSDIVGKFKLKERVAVAGEYEEIEHVESHIHIRPWKEENRGKVGFNADGFLSNHSIDLRIYDDGEPTTPLAKLEDLQRYGDYIYRKRIEARRLQEEYIFSAAAWRVVAIQEMYMTINKAAAPGLDYPQEDKWQSEFVGAYLWISRDRLRAKMNRATGKTMSGSYDSLVTGPDGQSNSAIASTILTTLSDTIQALTGDFSISLWIADCLLFPAKIYAQGVLSIYLDKIAGVCSLDFIDGTNNTGCDLTWTGSGWVHLVIQRSGTILYVYENGVKIYTHALVSTIVYGLTVSVLNQSILSCFDVRTIPRAVSAAAIVYYYDEIINNGKSTAFLPINR